MTKREEVAAQVAQELGFMYPPKVYDMNETGEMAREYVVKLWDALIDAKVELAEREQRLLFLQWQDVLLGRGVKGIDQ